MKLFKLKLATLAVIATAFATTSLLSFTHNKGGEGFEVYLNGKLLVQQFGNQAKAIKNIQLTQSNVNDQLMVKYFHCGHIAKSRSIAIKNSQDKLLKQWSYADASTSSLTSSGQAMTCKVKDILNLQKSNPGKLGLYYSSNEMSKERILVTITAGESTAGR